jgi:hypothetical protein
MAERGLLVDHTTVWRWCQRYGPMIYHRLRGKLRYTTTTWHMGRNLRSNRRPVGCICSVRWIVTAIRWIFYLSEKRDREAAKTFLQKALSDPDNRHSMPAVHGSVRIYPQRFEICESKGVYRRGVHEGPNDTPTIELNRTTDKSSEDSAPCRGHGRYRRRVESFRVSKPYTCYGRANYWDPREQIW